MAGSKRTTSVVDISEIDDEDQEVPLEPMAAHHGQGPSQGQFKSLSQSQGKPCRASQRPASAQLYLYHEDTAPQQRISSLLSTMGGLQPAPAPLQPASLEGPGPQLAAIDYHRPTPSPQPQAEPELEAGRPAASNTPAPDERPPERANLGTLTGVYFPCVQNIFGVILFIRMVWIVGTAGVPAAFTLVLVCCCVTLTTSISLSAIATNGIVPAGGSYFMISRSLGPECGGAVGTMFFLGTTVAGAMYITGAVEIMLNYLAPSMGLFGDFQRDVSIMYHNIRVYGTLLLIIVGLMVWIGVKFVSKLAPIALLCVLFSIFSIYAGIFINHAGRQDLMLCVLGDRLVTLKNMPYKEEPASPWARPPAAPTGGRNATTSKLDEAAQFELRRTRALCTYEKLRFVFCPSQQPALARPAEPEVGAEEEGGAPATTPPPARPEEQWAGLFERPPNMSNCDPYFEQNRHRIHLERAVPGE